MKHRFKKMVLLSVAIFSSATVFVACNDDNEFKPKDLHKEVVVNKDSRQVTFYLIGATFKDDKGVKHTYTGTIVVTYDSNNKPMFGTFTGYRDGKYIEDAFVSFYITSEKKDSDLENEINEQEAKGLTVIVFCAEYYEDLFNEFIAEP